MAEWKECTLGDVLSLKRGYDLPKSQMRDGNIPVAGSNGIIGFHDEFTPITPCITIGRSGNIGNVYYYDRCWAHNTTLYVDDYKGNNPKYLYYFLKTLPIASYAGGSAVPTLNRNHIYPIKVCFCSNVEKQKEIADILSSLDDKIEVNRKINENLEQQAEALFKSWFVDFDPFKDGKFIDSELGKIPEGWRVGTLSEIADITMGQSPQGSSYNENGDGIIFYQGRTEFGDRFPRVRLYTTEPKRYATPFSILLSVRAPVGDLNIVPYKCCIGRGLASLNSSQGYNSFLFYVMKNLKSKLDQFNGEGTVFGSINKKALENIDVLIPSSESILKFERIVKNIDRQIYVLSKENDNLANQRDTLLPKLMSGEINL